jgi:hypothetical protein
MVQQVSRAQGAQGSAEQDAQQTARRIVGPPVAEQQAVDGLVDQRPERQGGCRDCEQRQRHEGARPNQQWQCDERAQVQDRDCADEQRVDPALSGRPPVSGGGLL